MKFNIFLVLFIAPFAMILTGCFTCGDCDDCCVDTTTVAAASPVAVKSAPSKIAVKAPSLKAPVTADLPKCEVVTEYWGSSTYLKLTDINGYTYKLTRPITGTSNRYTTRTGWYLIDSTGKILKYQDTRKVRR